MARFYQTTERDFQDDFIFQPNWELAKLSMDKNEANIANAVETLNILGNPIFDYNKQVDSEYAREVKDRWETRIAEATEELSADPLNHIKNRRMLAGLQNELQKDFEFGDISKLQDNYNRIKKWSEDLGKLAITSDRENYQTILANYAAQAQGRGAESGLFDGPEFYESSGYLFSDFVESDYFKKLMPDGAEDVKVQQGNFIVKTKTGWKELSKDKIAEAYKGFVEDNPNVLGRALVGTQYFGEDNWFNEDGSLSVAPGSVLGNSMLRGSEAMSYRQETKDINYQNNPFAVMRAEHDFWIKKQQYGEEEVFKLAMGDMDVSNFVNKNQYAKEEERKYLTKLKSTLLSVAGLSSPMQQTTKEMFEDIEALDSIDSLMDYAKKNNFPTIYREAANEKERLQNEQRAGHAVLAQYGIKKKEIDAFDKSINKLYETYHKNFRYKVEDNMIFNTADGRVINLSKEIGDGKYGNGFLPDELIGKVISHPAVPGNKIMITGTTPTKGSMTVIPVNHPLKTGKPLTDNYAVGSLDISYKIVGEDGKVIDSEYADETFPLTVYMDMKKSVGADRN